MSEDAIVSTQGDVGVGLLNPALHTLGPTVHQQNDDLSAEIQKLDPSNFVELFIMDASAIGGSLVRFHAGTNKLSQNVWWQGQEYTRWPIAASGFAMSGQGQLPRPKLLTSNFAYIIGAMCMETDDLIMAKVTRIRTHLKYLDTVNFPGGVNPTADPSMEYRREIWNVNRKVNENDELVEFELASPMDVDGAMIPGRKVTATVCIWQYRSGEGCTYAGPPVATIDDQPTNDPAADKCSHKKRGCQFRFGVGNPLPAGMFPAAGLVR
jgi:lambda family phage minor tail protein L